MEEESRHAETEGEGVALQIALAEYQFLQAARAQAQDGGAKRYDAHLVALGFVGVLLSLVLREDSSITVLTLSASAGGAAIFLLGQVTFHRLIELTITSTTYTRGLNSIRRFLLELRPELGPYFVLPTDETQPHIYGVSTRRDRRVLLFNRAGSVAVLNSLAAGCVVGLWAAVSVGAVTNGDALEIGGGIVIGIMAALASTIWHYRVQRDRLQSAEAAYEKALQLRHSGRSLAPLERSRPSGWSDVS